MNRVMVEQFAVRHLAPEQSTHIACNATAHSNNTSNSNSNHSTTMPAIRNNNKNNNGT